MVKKNKTKMIDIVLSTTLVVVLMFCVNLVINKIYEKNEVVSAIGENRLMPIYNVDTDNNNIAITFNAVWGSDNTYKILDILDKYNIKATFFVTGYWANDNKDELIEIKNRGHELGNHTDNHTHGTQLSTEKNIEEILGVHTKVEKILDITMELYRPPFGEYNNTVIKSAEQLKYYPILWNIDSNDWMEKGIEYEVSTVLNNKNLDNGAIVLFHLGSKYTHHSLDKILEQLTKEYKMITVGELIYKENYHIDDNGVQMQN